MNEKEVVQGLHFLQEMIENVEMELNTYLNEFESIDALNMDNILNINLFISHSYFHYHHIYLFDFNNNTNYLWPV